MGRAGTDARERDTPWRQPPERLALGSDEVHVWRASLEPGAARLSELHPTLSADEQAKAARFRFQRDHDHYVAARGLLRAILGRYLNAPPASLRFSYSPYGKPSLAGETGDAPLRFNLSHSHELALYAFARGREIGIDLEYNRPDLADEDVAERFFSPHEVAALRALPPAARQEAFFRCWTRKEAYIKARGEGLSMPLDAFDVSLAPGEPPGLLETRADPAEASRWSLRALDPGPGYLAALAVEGHGWQLRCWQWAEPR